MKIGEIKINNRTWERSVNDIIAYEIIILPDKTNRVTKLRLEPAEVKRNG